MQNKGLFEYSCETLTLKNNAFKQSKDSVKEEVVQYSSFKKTPKVSFPEVYILNLFEKSKKNFKEKRVQKASIDKDSLDGLLHKINDEGRNWISFPTVYILYSRSTKKAYIGETGSLSNRLYSHISENKHPLEMLMVLGSYYFNKSSTLHIESNLIKHISADSNFTILNNNLGQFNHNYYQKHEYEQVFLKIWKYLQDKKFVKSPLTAIQNSHLFKFSPYKSLSKDQHESLIQLLQYLLNITKNKNARSVFIQGCSGTGKTILAVYLIKLLSSDFYNDNGEEDLLIQLVKKVQLKLKKDKKSIKIALVVPMKSLRCTLKKVFKNIDGLSIKMVIGASDLKKQDNYDLLVVDEAHRLKRRKNLNNYDSFDKTNQFFELKGKKTKNELDWIRVSSQYQLFFYDSDQSIRPTDIEKNDFKKVKEKSKIINLKSQMRSKGGSTYIEFVEKLLSTASDLKKWQSSTYELKLFTKMPEMIKKLEAKEKEFKLCRTIAGFAWKWISKKNKQLPDATIDGVDLYWNRTTDDWIFSNKKMTEMGCIHTTQGYDLNYAGIIFGNDITYNKETHKINIIKENYYDTQGKSGINDNNKLHEFIINIYRTLMFRSIKGTYVYCCDKKLREYFSRFIPIV